jgi:hypothetical protein
VGLLHVVHDLVDDRARQVLLVLGRAICLMVRASLASTRRTARRGRRRYSATPRGRTAAAACAAAIRSFSNSCWGSGAAPRARARGAPRRRSKLGRRGVDDVALRRGEQLALPRLGDALAHSRRRPPGAATRRCPSRCRRTRRTAPSGRGLVSLQAQPPPPTVSFGFLSIMVKRQAPIVSSPFVGRSQCHAPKVVRVRRVSLGGELLADGRLNLGGVLGAGLLGRRVAGQLGLDGLDRGRRDVLRGDVLGAVDQVVVLLDRRLVCAVGPLAGA